jgi:glucosamine--fructose-6-phosphate aminotransferase (isomerizing)
MAMMALAIGSDQISTQARRNAIISGLTSLPKYVELDTKVYYAAFFFD